MLAATKKALFLLLIALGIYYAVNEQPNLLRVFTLRADDILFVAAMSSLLLVVQALNFLQLLNIESPPPILATVRVWALSGLSNYLGPFQPGLAIRLYHFKKFGISLRKTSGTTFQQLQLSLWTASLITFITLLTIETPIAGLTLLFGVIAIAWPLLLRISRKIFLSPFGSNRLDPITHEALLQGLHIPPVTKLWPFLAQYLLVAVSIYFVYLDFGANITVSTALFIATITTLSGLFAVTPSNLGIQELILGYAAHLGGLSVADAIDIAVIFRLAHVGGCVSVFLLLGPVHQYTEYRRKTDH